MMKDLKLFRRNSSSNGNNENKPANQSETLANHLDPDPSRPPFTQIQEPVQNPIPVSRRKPESATTPSKNASFRTPEKQLSSVSSRNRFGWVTNNGTGTNNLEEISHHVPLPPLNRYGTITPRTYKHKASSVHSESSSTQSTPSKSVTKPAHGLIGSRPSVSVGNRVGFAKGLPVCSGPITVVDTPDVPHFELREDPSFWLDHNVQVVIRVRPLNSNERNLFGYNRCLKQESCQNITWIGQPETRFMFDYVACETISQEMLFRVAGLPMVENCMSGYNSCMFAYGQTGSGKTYTMLGEISDLNVKPSADRGMTPRIFEFLFARIRAEEEIRRDEKLRYNCKCSFLEIYNEQITDLLDPSSTNLLLREDVQKGVYVENLTEFKVESVHDILTLIIQGSANRRVAATNMNRESSRSHSVFTCVIESTWEKDSMSNFRFARLNLVDLAGSERQKTSGAEGERLKEAASINKSLSTLGHVIMVLSDLANGKQRHVPYRDSRLTFLLQDSLGGNSKTMIIANVSPSMCSANETLSTLKFAQRGRLIQNNAIVNEDMSGDVQALQHQIRLLKEELALLKRQNSERPNPNFEMDEFDETDEKLCGDPTNGDKRYSNASLHSIRISTKQWKSLEATLAGALRRERTAETTIKQLEAEIEQLNRLVRQREEDTRCTKMMLKFREDKINRMEALVKGKITAESYLCEDSKATMKEIELLRSKVERNPEVTRFALENIRLLDQLRRYQDFYEEGERDLLVNEISQLRNQLIQLLDGKPETDQQLCSEMENLENKNSNSGNSNGDNDSFSYELRKTSEELERCCNDLKSCLEMNEKLTREIADLHTELSASKSMQHEQCANEESFSNSKHEENSKHAEELLNLQLELDILKAILEEQKSTNSEIQEKFSHLETELNVSKSIIEALELQNIQLINELEEERVSSKLLKKTEPRQNSLRNLESEDSPLNAKMRKMQASLDKVRHLMHVPDSSVEREMDEVRKQVEIETAEVIVCLQEEINSFEEQLEASNTRIVDLEREKEERERDWERLADEIESALSDGNLALEEACDQVSTLSGAFSQKGRVELQVGNLIRGICERDEVIDELNKCLEDAQNVRCDLEWKLRSLRGATLAITEAHQQEKSEKQREIFVLREERESLYDQSVRSCLEKDVLMKCLIFAQSESELKFQEMESALQSQEVKIQEMKSRLERDTRQSQTGFQCLASQVFRLEGEIGDKERDFEIKMLNMESKMRKLEKNVAATNALWHKEREAHELELNDAKALSAQKAFENSNLMSKIEETHATIKDADTTVNALIHANETLKREIEGYQQEKTLISNEKSALLAQIETLNSSLGVKEREYELTCELVTDLETYIRQLPKLVLDKFESISCDVDQIKSEFKGCINLARALLGDTWLEIIRKDCAVSVFNLCEMGILVERVTGLSLENGFLQNGISESNSLISNLKASNLKAKNELELCSAVKGKLLADITNSFNRISNKEAETNEMKLKFNTFEKKILELQLREEMMLERSNCVYNELTTLVNELDSNKKCEFQNERERIFRVFEQVEREMTLSMIELHFSLGENEMLKNELQEIKGKNERLSDENYELRDVICASDLSIRNLKEELIRKNAQLEEASFASKTALTDLLRNYLHEFLTKRERTFNSMNERIDLVSNKVQKNVFEQIDMVSKIECELEVMETLFEELKAEKWSLQSELNRRDEISKGLLFDLKLLQESASIAEDEKEGEIENLAKELETLKVNLDDQNGEIEALLSEIEEKNNAMKTLQCENSELKSELVNLSCARDEMEAELREKTVTLQCENSELKSRLENLNCVRDETETELHGKIGLVKKLEEEMVTIQNLIYEKDGSIEELQNEINRLKQDLDMANALAEENEAIATEARQVCEEKKEYATEKEEEVKLLEKSIEELESTVYALESKVDLVKEEAEKQRIKRELLEAELHQVRKQFCARNQIFELNRNVEMLQKELSEKEAEISQCKGHISELNMHAEAQAREYKQRFKELEAMAQQVKSNESNGSAGPTNVSKNNRGSSSPFKGNRGSGSPFKCIGLGIIQQMNSEKEEDLIALKRQIEELESVASSRQKEIFMLNTRLAAAESMTHDVIRDLLGVKMDMSSYASLLNNCQKITPESDGQELMQEKEQEMKRLKKRLNEFIEERQGWIDEINQRQTEMMKARVAAEKLKQREQLLLTENEMLKCENENYKNRVVQLEDEMHGLPSQHSLHLRIHHHAKTKEENSILRQKNEDLCAKLQKTEGILASVRDELARYRVSNGKDLSFETQEEDQLRRQLQESEENRLKLADKLLYLCTSLLKLAGVTNTEADVSTTSAETALDLIRVRITSLEDEVHDLKLKCKLQREKDRLAELRWESSPLRVKLKEISNSPSNTFNSPSVSLS